MSPLEKVWEWYEVTKASQQFVIRLIKKENYDILEYSPFFGKPYAEVVDTLSRARKEMDDLVVLSLFSFFEQVVIKDYKEKNKIDHNAELEKKNFYAILDSYKSKDHSTLSKLIGLVKQVIEYRNWVAHGKEKVRPAAVDPLTAYERLQEFLDRILGGRN